VDLYELETKERSIHARSRTQFTHRVERQIAG
jgi:hypothetical protein